MYIRWMVSLCLMASLYIQGENQSSFVIGCRPQGFFSNFLAVLPNIVWAKKHGRAPVVFWDKHSLYYDPAYTDTENVWEYYFEPISSAECTDQYPYRRYESPDMQFIPWRKGELCFDDALRATYHAIVEQYIQIKPHVQKKIDDFYAEHMYGKITIGIHLRGTDKVTEAKQVSPRKILKKANKLAKALSQKGYECQFLVATDQQSLLNEAKKILKWPVIYYDAYRSQNHIALHYQRNIPSKYKLGEDIVIETYLLAACDHFVHTRSNVSIAVCILNPTLPHIFLEN